MCHLFVTERKYKQRPLETRVDLQLFRPRLRGFDQARQVCISGDTPAFHPQIVGRDADLGAGKHMLQQDNRVIVALSSDDTAQIRKPHTRAVAQAAADGYLFDHEDHTRPRFYRS